jgi:hypothetical protein
VAGINLTFAADTRSFLSGAAKVEGGLEDVGDSLDSLAAEAARTSSKAGNSLEDIGKEARQAGDKIENSIESAVRDTSQEAEKLERKFRDAFDEVKSQSKKAGDDIGDNVKRGTKDAEGGLKEFGDEANSTARESAASFDGSADSIVDAFQETAANAFAGFGPAAALAGLAMAAGIGALWTSFTENAEAAEQRVQDMYDDMRESGAAFLSEEFISEAISDIIKGVDGAATSLEDVKDQSERTGVSVATLLRAWAGDQEAVNEVIGQAQGKIDDIKGRYDGGVLSDAARQDVGNLQDVINAMEGVQGSTDTARDKVDLYSEAIAGLPQNKVTDLEVNTDPGRIGMGNFYRDPAVFGRRSVEVGMDPRADVSQFQREVDRAARSLRPPTVGFNWTPGTQRPV